MSANRLIIVGIVLLLATGCQSVNVLSNPPFATILIDGVATDEKTPYKYSLWNFETGYHKITVQKDGYKSMQPQEFRVKFSAAKILFSWWPPLLLKNIFSDDWKSVIPDELSTFELEPEISQANTALNEERSFNGQAPVAVSIKQSDIDTLPSTKAKERKSDYAIVIGIEQYRQKLPKADYAVHDAITVSEYLTKSLGYPEENVIILTNDRASKSDFEKYFEKWLPNNVEPGSTIFVYYSGHGAPNPKTSDAYLVPYDGDPSFIAETGYSLKRMYAALGKLPAKHVIVTLDSCFSGAGGRSVIAKGVRPLVMNLQSNVVLPMNMTVLSASSGDQMSSTYDEKGHGLFTYFMLKGIKNEDVTRPDGSLKIDDLYSYIKPQVERIARKQYNNEQTPQLIEPK